MSHYETLKGLGRAVAYYPKLGNMLGNPLAGIFLCQLVYWNDKTDNKLGVYKTAEEWKTETAMSYSQQSTARKLLRSLGILIETEKRLEHKIFFKLDVVAFDKWFQKNLENNDKELDKNSESREQQNVNSRNDDFEFGSQGNVSSGALNSNSVIHKITSLDYKHKNTSKKHGGYSKTFEKFWSSYPTCKRKSDKSGTAKTFAKYESSVDLDLLISVLEKQKQDASWIKQDGEYIPSPSAWLNQKQWENDFWVTRANGSPEKQEAQGTGFTFQLPTKPKGFLGGNQ